MSESIFEINKLTTFDDDWSKIEDVNLKLESGNIFALVGETGAGKTTFVNVLAGIIDDYDGEIIYKNRLLTKKEQKNIFGFIYQKSTLINKMTIAENLFFVDFPTRKIGPFISWKQVKKKAKEYLDYFDIDFDLNKNVGVLTSEEKKIIEFIKVFIKDPEIIILHEPTTNLSIDSLDKLYSIIKKLREKNKIIIYVTKQWEEGLKVADKIAVLTKGKIAGVLEAEEAKKNPKKLLNLFLGIYDERVKKDETPDVIDSIFKAAEFLTSEYELKDVLKFLAEKVTEIMGADSCVINLVDEKTETIIDRIEFKKTQNKIPQIKKDKIFEITKDNKLFYTNSREKGFNFLFDGDSYGINTVIMSSVLIRSQLASVIKLHYRNIYVYSEIEWKYLSTFARQAAIAIEDTRLMGRSALLQESHHRIKNNLQSIISLISIQKDFLKEDVDYDSVINILNDIMSRIKSIAAVHDLLSKDKMGRSIINIKEIINKVLDFAAYPSLNREIKIKKELEDIFIPYNKATTIVLIVNELVANCYEHAFSDQDFGKIIVKCKKINDRISLVIQDNGKGMPEDFDVENSTTLGLSIVYSIINNEFNGKIDFNALDKGTKVTIKIPFKY
ncbi:ribose transport system ATP-binding protein [Halanaerobium saccharolyticum]|uniref:histidine kinase n=1 Tax=Halanaerobium saccharolyticum TaxID=43595 RepID=A0A4R6LYD0_9FIRM|nr:ATP-binding cassette domain-containing protein [Halanaerobium saccharolyticum]TDO93857.1 ribose transport system ATP-binding protein [Halanaerobium saccharolyticum]